MVSVSSGGKPYETWVSLRRVTHIILKARNAELARYGISGVEAAVLSIANEEDSGVTPTQISRLLLRERNSVSALVTRMSRKGLVTKSQDADRKNVVRVSLTEKGRKAYRQAMELKSVREIFSVLSGEESEQLQVSLRKLRKKAIAQLEKSRKSHFV